MLEQVDCWHEMWNADEVDLLVQHDLLVQTAKIMHLRRFKRWEYSSAPVSGAAGRGVVVRAAETRQEAGGGLGRAGGASAGGRLADGGAVADDGHDLFQDLVVLGDLRIACATRGSARIYT